MGKIDAILTFWKAFIKHVDGIKKSTNKDVLIASSFGLALSDIDQNDEFNEMDFTLTGDSTDPEQKELKNLFENFLEKNWIDSFRKMSPGL